MELEGEEVECPMCGRPHTMQRNGNDGGSTSGFSDLVRIGQSTLENAKQAVTETLQVAGFSEQGIQRGSLASALQSRMGPVSEASLLSTAQSLAVRSTLSPNSKWIAAGAAIAVAGVAAGATAKVLYEKYQERNSKLEVERRLNLNLCEECWKVARFATGDGK